MARQATGSRLREDIDYGEDGRETDAPEPAPDFLTPPAETVEDIHHESEIPPLQTTPKRKGSGGIVTLIILALLGMALGFAAVMLI